MKAPDNVYIASYNGEAFSHSWTMEPLGDTTATEYIRKDVLLEKLEKVAAEYKKRSNEGELVWQNMCGIKEAIDILNKM